MPWKALLILLGVVELIILTLIGLYFYGLENKEKPEVREESVIQ